MYQYKLFIDKYFEHREHYASNYRADSIEANSLLHIQYLSKII